MRAIIPLVITYTYTRMTRSFVFLGKLILLLRMHADLSGSLIRTVRKCHCSVLVYSLASDYHPHRNIGNARIAGLEKDLKMTDHQFSTALTVT